MARKTLTDPDVEAWASYARHVAAFPGRALPALASEHVASTAPSHPSPIPTGPPPRLATRPEIAVGQQPAGLDKASWARLRTGKMVPTRTLDLHGRTAQHAYAALQVFLLRAYADRIRCVEIITGRGSGEHGGVIRRELPLWLNLPQVSPLVLAVTHPHAANVGSVRLLLRKPR